MKRPPGYWFRHGWFWWVMSYWIVYEIGHQLLEVPRFLAFLGALAFQWSVMFGLPWADPPLYWTLMCLKERVWKWPQRVYLWSGVFKYNIHGVYHIGLPEIGPPPSLMEEMGKLGVDRKTFDRIALDGMARQLIGKEFTTPKGQRVIIQTALAKKDRVICGYVLPDRGKRGPRKKKQHRKLPLPSIRRAPRLGNVTT